MTDDTSKLRKTLRRAESAANSPEQAKELEAEGIFLGDEEEFDREALLAELEAGEPSSEPTVWVEVTTGSSPLADRGVIEDPLADFVESEGIGCWTGSGEGSHGDRHFFDISFEVEDPVAAVEQIHSYLTQRFPKIVAKISGSDGTIKEIS